MYEGELAIGISSFNRPKLLNQLLESLEENTLSEKTDVYVFQGGKRNPFSGLKHLSRSKMQECLDVCFSSDLDLRIYKWIQNYGIGIGQFGMKKKLFDDLGYDHALFFEDDLKVTKSYVHLIRVLLDQFKHFEKVGTVQATGLNPEHHILSYKEKKGKLHKLITGDYHWWGWGTWKQKWKRMEDWFLKYYKLINSYDYTLLNRWQIKKFYLKHNFRWGGVGTQDKAMAFARFKCDMFPVNTVVNRVINIGRRGRHYSEESWKEQRRDKHTLDHFPHDRKIEQFEDINEKQFWKIQEKIFTRNDTLGMNEKIRLECMASLQEGLWRLSRSVFQLGNEDLNNILSKGVKLWSKPPR